MDKQQLQQAGVLVAILIIALMLLPIVTGLISLLVKLILLGVIVAALYGAYQVFSRR